MLGGEEDGSEADDQGQTTDESVSVPNRLTNPPIEEQTNDLTNNNTVAETRLPRRRNFPVAVGQLLAVLALELRKAEEVVQQADIVAFHDDASTDQDRPANRLGVQLNALPQRHVVLLLGRETGIIDDPVMRALVMLVLVERL